MSKRHKYRSNLEQRVGVTLGDSWGYEDSKLLYEVAHSYTPDFTFQLDDHSRIWVEVKGFFRPGDTQKYKAIRDELKHIKQAVSTDFVFFLQSPRKPVRKGAKLTMADWCEKEGMKWFEDPEVLARYIHE